MHNKAHKVKTILTLLSLGLLPGVSQARPIEVKTSEVVSAISAKLKSPAKVKIKAPAKVDIAPPEVTAAEIDQNILPSQTYLGKPEVVAKFYDSMPTGVAVSFGGRRFVNFPRWEDLVPTTVAEIVDGKCVPYPDAEINKLDLNDAEHHLISVQSVVIDPLNRLWILDTGSVKFGPVLDKAAKLVCVDLTTNKTVKAITFDNDVALPQSYLNDVRFDLSRGKAGMAFITDSSSRGKNALIVVDLATGKSMRRLEDHISVRAVPGFIPFVEGSPLLYIAPNGECTSLKVGCDGIAIGADGEHLYYCPLSSRKLYSVSLNALCDPDVSEDDVAKTVCEVTEKGASDGLESDAQGRIYTTDYEHNAVRRISLSGKHETLVCDPRVLWPDTLCLAQDGYLYFTTNQLNRQAAFHQGADLRQKPYVLFRIKVDATPVQLK